MMTDGSLRSKQESLDDEDEQLYRLGVKRELRREFKNFSAISFAVGILGIAATVSSTFNTPILLGGRAVAVWSWFLGSFGCCAIAASVAELASAYPTAGGLYTSTAFVVPKSYRASITFLSAWMTLIGQLAAQASANYAFAQMVFAAVTIGTDGNFVATQADILGVYIGFTALLGLLISLPTRTQHQISYSFVYFNIFTALAITIAIPASGTSKLASSSSVWTGITDNSGWNNTGFAFLLGLLCVQYVMTDYDAVAHISEEVKNAATAAPIAIVVGVPITAVLGWFLVISLCYGIVDPSALPGPTGLVVSQILWDNVGKKAALFLWSCVIINEAMVAATVQMACTRSIYAISRDNALPDGRLLSKLWFQTKTPVFAVIFSTIVCILFGLLSLASFTAINAIFSVAAVALDLSYAIPIIAKMYIEIRKHPETRFTPGPFNLGRYGLFVNAYAVAWTFLETGVLIMPQVRPVTAATMNYSAPILGGICGLSWLWYILYWHGHYLGPAHRFVSSDETTSSASNDAEKAHQVKSEINEAP